MRQNYHIIVKNLDATIDHLVKKMIHVHEDIAAYVDLQDQIDYYKMLRKACLKRIASEPIIEKLEEISEVYADNVVVAEEIYIIEKILCRHCHNPILDDFTNCPICGTKISWDPILYRDGIKIAENDNGFLKKIRSPLADYVDDLHQLNMFEGDQQ